jgi:hypothetical protein
MPRMKRAWWIVAGYLLAGGIGSAAVMLRYTWADPRDVIASSGMWAFGDALTFLAVAGGLALVPTFFLFRALRGRPGLWTVPSWALLLWGVIGVAAAAIRFSPKSPAGALATLDVFAVLRFLPAPLFAGLDAMGWLVAPEPRTQRRLALAAGLELVACTPWLPLLWQLTPFRH